MSIKSHLACVLLSIVLAGSASASPIVLTFEGIGDRAGIAQFYNGGMDTHGNVGPNYGISFAEGALGLIDEEAGGTGNIANEPSGDTVMYFRDGNALLNHEAGFDTGFSFFYSSASIAVVNVYSGLNATGVLLGSIDLAIQGATNCVGDPLGQYCNFTAAGVSFAGLAHSIVFGGGENLIVYDDITFGSAVPGNVVPEPGTIALLGIGLLGMTAARRSLMRRNG